MDAVYHLRNHGTARPAMGMDPGFSVLLPVTVGHGRETLAPSWLPTAKVLCPPTPAFAARARYRPKWPDTGIVTAPTPPAAPIVALMAAMALVTCFRAVRAGVRAHHTGPPGPDPAPDRAEGPARGSTTPERELSHV
ncbi:hypothetical protein ABTX82_01975 [Streptomyces lavendulae]|uniref:hypothetical protein n=1 Tax=Streptomyces lavendulae TaxID=1914 RepID=UPI0033312A05